MSQITVTSKELHSICALTVRKKIKSLTPQELVEELLHDLEEEEARLKETLSKSLKTYTRTSTVIVGLEHRIAYNKTLHTRLRMLVSEMNRIFDPAQK